MNIQDQRADTALVPPFNGRVIVLSTTPTPAGFQASDLYLHRSWQSAADDLKFNIGYNASGQNGQNGFVGSRTVQVPLLLTNATAGQPDQMAATITLDGQAGIHFDISEHNSQPKVMLAANNLPFLTAINGITAKQVSIQSGSLPRIKMHAALGGSDGLIKGVLDGTSQLDFDTTVTPASAQIDIKADASLDSEDLGGKVVVHGHIGLATTFSGEVDAEVDASINADALTLEGALNWHIGQNSVWWLQGQGKLPWGDVTLEGGFFTGNRAPTGNVWIMGNELQMLPGIPNPQTLSGFYGYGGASKPFDVPFLSGGVEVLVGQGLLNGTANYVGHLGVHAWGEILGGLVSADGWAGATFVSAPTPHFCGNVDLRGCLGWGSICKSVDIPFTLDQDGFRLSSCPNYQ